MLRLFFSVLLLFVGVAPNSLAQTFPGKKSNLRLFENATIVPNAKIPVVLKGISGGTKETQQISLLPKTETGECIGFVDQAPDHEIILRSKFDYLRFAVMSSGDTVLLVKGPGGTWCSDDVTDRNPKLEGQWLGGTYSVWVGSYEKDSSHPYILEIIETPAP